MSKTKSYKVTGVSHYTKAILSLKVENIDYDYSKKELIDEGLENDKIYQYEYYPIKTELVPEPDNPYDPNAIKVIVDNVLVGYIKSGSCSHVLKLINEGKIEKIETIISGGKYKYLDYDEYEDKYDLIKSEDPLIVNLKITEN